MAVTVLEVAGQRIAIDSETTPSFTELPPAARALVGAIVLCNDSETNRDDAGETSLIGDPTETAMVQLALDAGLDVQGLRTRVPRTAENPLDSVRKRMSTIHESLAAAGDVFAALPDERPVAFVKGAIDGLIAHATRIWSADGPVELDAARRASVLSANDQMAATGRRVLGVAYRTYDQTGRPDAEAAESNLVILGLVGMIDPPRPEVRDAVATCRAAGIRPVMITGDHPLTALAIAQELGIATDDRVLTGVELDRLSDTEFDKAAAEVSVFARVSPEHKLRIVASLQDRDDVVAMTGDGVNDAPALKRADIGVAMGITGTDVSKAASDMVLRDDNFTTIVAAVEEGRVIYDNLRRFVSFAVAGNLGKIVVMLGWPIPYLLAGGPVAAAVALSPLQLLWLNLMTDGLLGLSMGMEPAERGVMSRAPHRPGESIWANGLGRRTAWVGALIGVVSLAVGFAYRESDQVEWQTMIFTTLAFMQIAQAFATRSNTEFLRSIGWKSNPLMLGIASLVLALQFIAIYTPLGSFMDLEPLGVEDLAVSVGAGLGLLLVLECVKAIGRRDLTVHLEHRQSEFN
jgi:Ca2+-transporting ATPase